MIWYSLFLLAALAYSTDAYRVVCYYTNWAQYRFGKGVFVPEDIDPFLCTHIVYAFGKPVSLDITPFEWNDDSTPWSKGMYERTIDLKQKNPNLKIILAIGGYNMGSQPFMPLVDTASSRVKFAQNAIAYLRQRGFDGLDMDWEYPGSRGSPPSDKQKLVFLMQELMRAFTAEAAQTGQSRLLLTGAFPAGKSTIDDGYDIAALAQTMDFISLMTYDYHGSWEPYTGLNSPLYAHSSETGDDRFLNLDWTASYYVARGAPKDKINVGIATYGRSFRLDSPSQHGIRAPAQQPGDAGHFTGEKGFISYYEVCDMLQSGAQSYDVPSQRNRYLVQGDQWVGYDDKQSVTEKACYTKQHGFGGVMFWALDLDDFTGQTCGQGTYPLIKAVKQEMSSPSFTNCVQPGSGTQALGTTAPPYQPPVNYPTQVPVQTQTTGPNVQPGGGLINPAQSFPPYMFTLAPANNLGPGVTQLTSAPFLPTQQPVKSTQRPVIPTQQPVQPTQQPGGLQPGPQIPFAFTLPVQGATPRPPLFTVPVQQPTTGPRQTQGPMQTQGPIYPLPTFGPIYTSGPQQPTTAPRQTQGPVYSLPTLAPVYTARPTAPPIQPVVTYQPVQTFAPVQPIATNSPFQPGGITPSMTQSYFFDCTNKLNDFYTDPNSCEHFYICADGVSYRVQCATGLLFNANVKHCDFSYNSNCPQTATQAPAPLLVTNPPMTAAPVTSAPSVNQNNPCASAPDGLTIHPTDCHKFYQCVSGIGYEIDCQAGMIFDPVLMVCNYGTICPSP